MSKYLEPEIVENIANAKEIAWINPKLKSFYTAKEDLKVTEEEIDDANQRLERFAPFIMKCFPETIPPQFCRYFWNTITRKPVFIRLPRFFYFIFMSCFDCERRRNVL